MQQDHLGRHAIRRQHRVERDGGQSHRGDAKCGADRAEHPFPVGRRSASADANRARMDVENCNGMSAKNNAPNPTCIRVAIA